MKKSKAKTYEGLPCGTCGGTERYERTGGCVACYRKGKSRTGTNVAPTAPDPIRRPRGWPKAETRAGDVVPADPIFVRMMQ